jgi:hypothetical protein
MVSARGSVRLSGIFSICACVAEIISTFDMFGLHVCVASKQEKYIATERTLCIFVWIAIAQDNNGHSGLEYRLANCSVPSSEH